MRFDKYCSSYEVHQLKKVLKIKSGRDQKQVETKDGKYNIYGTGGIIGHTNNFLYDKESVGIGRKGTIDKPVYFDKPFWTVDTLFYSEIFKGFYPKYIYYLFHTINWKKYNTSTGVPSLTSSSIESIEKCFPSFDEQVRIANFLTLIDNKIDTQIKIINNLLSQKNHIINMLTENKSREFYISDLMEIGRGRVISSNEINKDYGNNYPVYSSQTSNNGIMGYLSTYDYDGEYITWTTDGANAGTVYYRKGKFNCTNVCGILKAKKHNIDLFYISKILSLCTKKYVSTNLANPKLMNNVMANIKIPVPSLDVQRNCSMKIKSLEEKIYIENLILEKYQIQKQYLLKNMFI